MKTSRFVRPSVALVLGVLIGGAIVRTPSHADPTPALVITPRPVGQWPPHLDTPAWRLAVDQDRVFSIQLRGSLSCLGLDADRAPLEIGRLEIPATLWDFDVEGDLALVTVAYFGQLLFLDVHDPTRPRLILTHTPSRPPRLVRLRNGYAFVLAHDGTLEVLDIQDPLHPVTLGSVPTPTSDAVDLHVTENDVWLVSRFSPPANIRRIDVRNPAMPVDRTPANLPGLGQIDSGVLMSGPWLYGTSQRRGGFHVLDLANPDDPSLIRTVPLPIEAGRFALAPTTAAVLVVGGVQLLDLADAREPRIIGPIVLPGEATDVRWDGARYWIAGNSGITVIDPAPLSSLPANPFIFPARDFGAVDVVNDLAAVASADLGVTFFDVSRPDHPQLVSIVPVPRARDVRIVGPWAHVAAAAVPGFTLIDIHDPRNPVTIARTVDEPVHGLYVQGRHVLLGMLRGGLRVLDVSQPESPREVASVPTRYTTNGVRIAGSFAWVPGSGGIEIYDVRDPSLPRWLGYHETSEWVTGLDIAGSWACAATDKGHLHVFEISQPAEPRLLWSAAPAKSLIALRASATMAVAVANTNRNQLIAVPIGSSNGYRIATHEFDSLGFQGLALQGSRAYLAEGPLGLRIVDLQLRRVQTLDLALPAERHLDDPPLELHPTASSGLSVTLTVASGPARLEGDRLVPTHPGLVTLRVTQPGNEEWHPAELMLEISFRGQPQSISWTRLPAEPLIVDRGYPIEATASSGLPVNLSISSGLATLEGNLLRPDRRRTLIVEARQPGNEHWEPATPLERVLEVVGPSRTLLVWRNSPLPTPPYATWDTAAHGIQDAIASAVHNDTVLVTNGIYRTGVAIVGTAEYPFLTNRIALTKPITVRSVHGPAVTRIEGDPAGVRCAYVGEGALLHGFTLTRGGAIGGNGGGALCDELGMVENCILGENTATGAGGGVHGGMIFNSAITRNRAATGGGASDSRLFHCTVTWNSALTGGGTAGSTARNSIVYHNDAPDGANSSSTDFTFSCTTPLPLGPGNLGADPELVTSTQLSPSSPCLGTGDPDLAFGTDLDGDPWRHPPSLGADEPAPADPDYPPTLRIQASAWSAENPDDPITFTAHGTSGITRTVWDFGDGTRTTNQPVITHAWTNPGVHHVILTAFNEAFPDGVRVSNPIPVGVGSVVAHVDAANPTPVPPHATWQTAANTIQDAIDAAPHGALVLVTNGVYRDGMARDPLGTLNRIVIKYGVTVRSVHGPAVTVIEGVPSQMRCAYLEPGASLSGFTLADSWAFFGRGFASDEGAGPVTDCWLVGGEARLEPDASPPRFVDMSRTSNGLRLEWPARGTLQETPTLAPASWADSQTGGATAITIPFTSRAIFLRLIEKFP